MAATPSEVQLAGKVETAGTAGGAVNAPLLNDALAAEGQLPSSAVKV